MGSPPGDDIVGYLRRDMATSVVGKAVTRVDGRLKVTGRAAYAVDHPIENLAYGVPVASTIASGKITNIDASAAERMPLMTSGPFHRLRISFTCSHDS